MSPVYSLATGVLRETSAGTIRHCAVLSSVVPSSQVVFSLSIKDKVTTLYVPTLVAEVIPLMVKTPLIPVKSSGVIVITSPVYSLATRV